MEEVIDFYREQLLPPRPALKSGLCPEGFEASPKKAGLPRRGAGKATL
ncbi:hypothetical protein [Bradyrhizobium sp. USDA 10063]